MRPSPFFVAVTSGVPSLRRAQTSTSAEIFAGSASTCRLTVTSSGIFRPANGLASSNAANGCGVDHDSAPPNDRPPARNGTGSNSSPPFSRRGPAKRTSAPPRLTKSSARFAGSPVKVPMSASIRTEMFCFKSASSESARLASFETASSA